jgi:COMPASS component SWD3
MAAPASSAPDPFLKNALEKSRRENALLQDRVRELEDAVAALRRTVLLLTTATNGAAAHTTPHGAPAKISPHVLQSIYERATSGISSAASVGISANYVGGAAAAAAASARAVPPALPAATAADSPEPPPPPESAATATGSANGESTGTAADGGSTSSLSGTHVASVDGSAPSATQSVSGGIIEAAGGGGDAGGGDSFSLARSRAPSAGRLSGSIAVTREASTNGFIGAGFPGFAERLELKAHNSAVYAIRFSPDGTKLVSSSFDRSIAVWPMDNYVSSASSNPLHVVPEAHRGPVVAVEWMHDSSRVITGAFDASAAEWDLGKAQNFPVSRFLARGLVHAVTASPYNENVFFVGTSRHAVHMFDCRIRSKASNFHQPTVLLPDVQLGNLSAAARGPCDESSVIAENNAAVYSIHADLDGNHILTGDHEGAIKTWDLRALGNSQSANSSRMGHAMLQQTTFNDPHHRPITHVHCSPPSMGAESGRLVAVNSYDTFLRVYDRGASLFTAAAAELKPLHALRGVINRNWPIKSSFFMGRDYRPPRKTSWRQPRRRESARRKTAVDTDDAFSGSNSAQTAYSALGTNALEDSRQSVPLAMSRDFDSDLDCDHEEQSVSSSGEDEARDHLQHVGGPYRPLHMPIRGALILASGSADGTVLIYDVGGEPGTGGLVQALKGHRDRVHSVDFHPSEPILASCSADGQVKIWSASSRH